MRTSSRSGVRSAPLRVRPDAHAHAGRLAQPHRVRDAAHDRAGVEALLEADNFNLAVREAGALKALFFCLHARVAWMLSDCCTAPVT